MNPISSRLDSAKRGLMTDGEVAELVDCLSRQRCPDAYTAIHILGHAAGPELAPVVEPYLEYSEDPMVARIALQVLCAYWRLAANYRDAIERFVNGVDWDIQSGRFVQLVAMTEAGELVRDFGDKALLRRLTELALADDVPAVVRDGAYAGLVLATGGAWTDVPNPAATDPSMDPEVLRRAAKLLDAAR